MRYNQVESSICGRKWGDAMATISLCMIVKDEEDILARCLDGIADLMDEIIIVDTGSTDRTKEIAAKYTDKIFDFEWKDDFASARNYAFSKATMDYIYSADADEVIDEENHERFRLLKEAMLSEIEIVQMYYTNQLEYNTSYNFDEELRPKLYKRVRNFTWQDAVHENVRLEPVVFNSDIRIKHCPTGAHQSRDFSIYQKLIDGKKTISAHMQMMYARELFISGSDDDFLNAEDYFKKCMEKDEDLELLYMDSCVVAKAARLRDEPEGLLLAASRALDAGDAPSELLFELAEYYRNHKNYKEAAKWYHNSAFESEAILNASYNSSYPLVGLHICYVIMGDTEKAAKYAALLRESRV